MTDTSGERRAERPVWTPSTDAVQTATVRPMGPGQDVAATSLAAELLAIAEPALADRFAAERLVTAIMRNQNQLVTSAIGAATQSQREVARQALERTVRRAVLDSLPPVVPAPSIMDDAGSTRGKAASGRKPRPLAVKNTTDFPPEPQRRGKRPRGWIVLASLMVLLLVVAATWRFAFGPESNVQLPSQEASRPVPPPPIDTVPDGMQLEAFEPRRRAERGTAAAGAGETTVPATTAEPPAVVAASPPLPESTRETIPPASGLALSGNTLRLFILYPNGGQPAKEAGELYAALSQTGVLPMVVLREVGFEIAAPRIRYFYEQDAAAARSLAEYLEPPRNGSWVIQDFSYVRPLPANGTIEIYVPSP